MVRRDPPDRREFITSSGSALGGAWLLRLAPLLPSAQACARDVARSDDPFTVFTAREGADFDALAARIVPTDDTPGAREAGVVRFADRALGTFLSDFLPAIRQGLASLAERASGSAGASVAFADLTEPQQDELIGSVEREQPAFFSLARTLVVLGLVSHPEYGGNQDLAGWGLIGFEERYVYQPPFGYYDRDEHGSPGAGR